MSDWEDDDFDPSVKVTDKIVALGLDRQADEKRSEPAKNGELTEKEKQELQMRSDAEIFNDLIGIEVKAVKKPGEELQKKTDFAQYAEDIAEQILSHRDHVQYMFFVKSLFAAICKPMNKLQLESMTEEVEKILAPLRKKEEADRRKQEEEKMQTKVKKAKKKALFEDTVADEYDDFDAKYNS